MNLHCAAELRAVIAVDVELQSAAKWFCWEGRRYKTHLLLAARLHRARPQRLVRHGLARDPRGDAPPRVRASRPPPLRGCQCRS